LTCEEAKQVINALTEGATITEEEPRKLKSLRMNITRLSVPFLDLLACKLPQLKKLFLVVSEIVGSGQVCFLSYLSTLSHLHLIAFIL